MSSTEKLNLLVGYGRFVRHKMRNISLRVPKGIETRRCALYWIWKTRKGE